MSPLAVAVGRCRSRRRRRLQPQALCRYRPEQNDDHRMHLEKLTVRASPLGYRRAVSVGKVRQDTIMMMMPPCGRTSKFGRSVLFRH